MHKLCLFLSSGEMALVSTGHIERHEVMCSIGVVKMPAERRKDGLELFHHCNDCAGDEQLRRGAPEASYERNQQTKMVAVF